MTFIPSYFQNQQDRFFAAMLLPDMACLTAADRTMWRHLAQAGPIKWSLTLSLIYRKSSLSLSNSAISFPLAIQTFLDACLCPEGQFTCSYLAALGLAALSLVWQTLPHHGQSYPKWHGWVGPLVWVPCPHTVALQGMRYFDLYHAQLWGHFSKADLGCHWFSPVGSPAASKGPGSDQNFKAWNHFSFPISAFSHPSPAFPPQMMLVEPCKTRDVPCREKKKKTLPDYMHFIFTCLKLKSDQVSFCYQRQKNLGQDTSFAIERSLPAV